jgi:adenylate kinase
MNFVLIGPPGVGKGTQAAILQSRTGLRHVASGDLFRRHMLEQTPLGQLAQDYVRRGELVPDELVIDMILHRITEPDCAQGVLFDGFPRTREQAEALTPALAATDRAVDTVIYLTAPRQVLLRRIIGRQTCKLCQAPYNIYYTPPRLEAVCDLCGGELYTRPDDNMETARHRLEVYLEQTLPLVEYYRGSPAAVHEIDATADVSDVTADILRRVGVPERSG